MGRCNCWEERIEYKPLHNIIGNPDVAIPYGVCLGTKEVDRCDCDGDESKCDFYPEKRKAAERGLTTAEMWLKAQEDGKTYIVNELQTLGYSKQRGLFFIADLTSNNRLSDFKDWSIDDLFNLKWRVMQEEIMTKAEAEEKFGVRIVD